MRKLIFLLLLAVAPAWSQESETFFHGSATMRQKGGPDITGAVTVQRQDRDYGPDGWCAEHWSIQFTPAFSDLSFIRDVATDAAPEKNSDNWAHAWIVNQDGRHWPPGGFLYILSDRYAKAWLLITPASSAVRASLYIPTTEEWLANLQDARLKKYVSESIFMYGFRLIHPVGSDYVQIDLQNPCP